MNQVTIAGALLGALFSATATAQESGMSNFSRDGLGTTPIATTLERLRETPEAFQGVKVTFTAQFCGIGQVSNPFFTRFTPSEFANFYLWSDGQKLWQQDHYDDVFGFCFLPKDSSQLIALYDLEPFDRLTLQGVVRNTFQSEPWIEVKSFTVVPGRVNVATLAHMFRAEQAMERRQWEKAIQELQRVRGGETTDTVAAATAKNMAIAYLRLGEAPKATQELRLANSLYKGKDLETRQLLGIASEAPEGELDRQVTTTSIEPHLRPMWEAFESPEDPFASPEPPSSLR